MSKTTTTPVGRALARFRRERGWSSYRLAQRAALPLPTVRQVEKGSDPKLSTLTKLAAALGVAVGQLVATEGEPGTGR